MATRGKCSLTLVFRNGGKTDLAIAESGLLDADSAWSPGQQPSARLPQKSAASIGIRGNGSKRIGLRLRLAAGADTLAITATMDPATNTVTLDPPPADGPAGPGKLRVSWALIDDEEPAYQIWQGDLVMG